MSPRRRSGLNVGAVAGGAKPGKLREAGKTRRRKVVVVVAVSAARGKGITTGEEGGRNEGCSFISWGRRGYFSHFPIDFSSKKKWEHK
jgi:hypothetical protein